jgi:broad specificity phosphatase PhoE
MAASILHLALYYGGRSRSMFESRKPVAFVIRHGTTVLNTDNAFRGMLDPELDDAGIRDGHRAADFLSRQPIERIISSPLARTVETAQILSGVLGGRCIEQCRCLFPWQMGTEFYGESKEKKADELAQYVKNIHKTPLNGESLANFIERTGDFFEDKLRQPILTAFVTHSSNIIALNDLLNGTAPQHPEDAAVVKPGGVCVIYETENGYELKAVLRAETKGEFGS